jgi:hypothetical protein
MKNFVVYVGHVLFLGDWKVADLDGLDMCLGREGVERMNLN